MNRKQILALVIAGAFAAPMATAYAQSDEKEPKKPEQSQLFVADGDDAHPYPKGSTPDLIGQSDEKEPRKPELAA